jgi:HEAT repeat protein
MASFKTDISFLEKISIGAIGTRKVFENLKLQGHKPIELERGSMNYKIWKKIKIKRIRVPDILCVDCGVRVESRAKTKLEITMSHSFSDPERGWDAGLKDDDYVALVVCQKTGERPIDWEADELIQYLAIRDLREAKRQNRIVSVKPKGAGEGFEARITWPAMVASSHGTIKTITSKRIQFSRLRDNRTISLSLTKKGLVMDPLVNVGQEISKQQILASVVPVTQSFTAPPVDENYFLDSLASSDLSERYAAAKALSSPDNSKVQETLLAKLVDSNEHIYVKLEAVASLARCNIEAGYDFIKACLYDNSLQNILEAVIVLAEIKTKKSCQLLCDVLQDENQNTEIKAGAAWSLGELNNKVALKALTQSFNTVSESIKVEAARALGKLTKEFSPEIVEEFHHATPIQRPGLAWALARSDSLHIKELIRCLTDEDTRQWIAYIIGTQGEEKYIAEIEKLKNVDPEVYFAVTVLWKIMTSWVYELTEY